MFRNVLKPTCRRTPKALVPVGQKHIVTYFGHYLADFFEVRAAP